MRYNHLVLKFIVGFFSSFLGFFPATVYSLNIYVRCGVLVKWRKSPLESTTSVESLAIIVFATLTSQCIYQHRHHHIKRMIPIRDTHTLVHTAHQVQIDTKSKRTNVTKRNRSIKNPKFQKIKIKRDRLRFWRSLSFSIQCIACDFWSNLIRCHYDYVITS